LPLEVTSAALIGVNLGPNLSVTGSLATILWIAALRREGVQVGAWAFLRLGIFVMPASFGAFNPGGDLVGSRSLVARVTRTEGTVSSA
jgi:Arsenical pump membrane protein